MKKYVIRFYNLSKDDECTYCIAGKRKCDANALRIIATRMQHSRVESISFINSGCTRFAVVRFH